MVPKALAEERELAIQISSGVGKVYGSLVDLQVFEHEGHGSKLPEAERGRAEQENR